MTYTHISTTHDHPAHLSFPKGHLCNLNHRQLEFKIYEVTSSLVVNDLIIL